MLAASVLLLLDMFVINWCDGVCQSGHPPICASSAARYLLVQGVVHCGPLFSVHGN